MITLSFPYRSHQKNIVVEHCSNTRVHPCPFIAAAYTDDNKTQSAYKVNENIPIQPINYNTFIFEVDMLDYQSKIMTYRYTYRQNQVSFDKKYFLVTEVKIYFKFLFRILARSLRRNWVSSSPSTISSSIGIAMTKIDIIVTCSNKKRNCKIS